MYILKLAPFSPWGKGWDRGDKLILQNFIYPSLKTIHSECNYSTEKCSPHNINDYKIYWIIFEKGKVCQVIHCVHQKSHKRSIHKCRLITGNESRFEYENKYHRNNNKPCHKSYSKLHINASILRSDKISKIIDNKLMYYSPEKYCISDKYHKISNSKSKHKF